MFFLNYTMSVTYVNMSMSEVIAAMRGNAFFDNKDYSKFDKLAAIDAPLLRRSVKSREVTRTIDPDTGERLRDMTEDERYNGLVNNSWVTVYDF